MQFSAQFLAVADSSRYLATAGGAQVGAILPHFIAAPEHMRIVVDAAFEGSVLPRPGDFPVRPPSNFGGSHALVVGGVRAL